MKVNFEMGEKRNDTLKSWSYFGSLKIEQNKVEKELTVEWIQLLNSSKSSRYIIAKNRDVYGYYIHIHLMRNPYIAHIF